MKICAYCDKVFNICHCSESENNGQPCPIKNESSCSYIRLRPEIEGQRMRSMSSENTEPKDWTGTNHTVYIYNADSSCTKLFHSLTCFYATVLYNTKKIHSTTQLYISFCPICNKYYVSEECLEMANYIVSNITIADYKYPSHIYQAAPLLKKHKKKKKKKKHIYISK